MVVVIRYDGDTTSWLNKAAMHTSQLVAANKPQILLASMLAGQALALVLTLLLKGSDWWQFGLLSFVIQWHILLTFAGLVLTNRVVRTLRLKEQAIVTWLISLAAALAIQFITSKIQLQPFSLTSFGAALVISLVVCYGLYLHRHATQLSTLAHAAKADALAARINPHFLFNTLNSIASLASKKSDKTEEAVLALSDIFRASLKQSQAFHTMADELALVQDYILLEQLRLGKRLVYSQSIDSNIPIDLPVLLLQPLVENAVKHGIAKRPNGGEILLSVSKEKNHWKISVKNPIPEPHQPDNSGSGLALEITDARLKLAYGDESKVLRSVYNQTHLVSLIIKTPS